MPDPPLAPTLRRSAASVYVQSHAANIAGITMPTLTQSEAIVLAMVVILVVLILVCCCKRKIARCFAWIGCTFCIELLIGKDDDDHEEAEAELHYNRGVSSHDDESNGTATTEEEAVFPFCEEDYDRERFGSLSTIGQNGSIASDSPVRIRQAYAQNQLVRVNSGRGVSVLRFDPRIEHKADEPWQTNNDSDDDNCRDDDDDDDDVDSDDDGCGVDELTLQNTVKNAQFSRTASTPDSLRKSKQMTPGSDGGRTLSNIERFAQDFPVGRVGLNRVLSAQTMSKQVTFRTSSLYQMEIPKSPQTPPMHRSPLGASRRHTPAEIASLFERVMLELQLNVLRRSVSEHDQSSIDLDIDVQEVYDEWGSSDEEGVEFPRESILSNDDGSAFEPQIEGRILDVIERKLTQRSLLEALSLEEADENSGEASSDGSSSDEMDGFDPDVERHIGQTIERKLTHRSLLASARSEQNEAMNTVEVPHESPLAAVPKSAEQYNRRKNRLVLRIAASVEAKLASSDQPPVAQQEGSALHDAR